MKLMKNILLSVISAILIGLSLSYKLLNQVNKEMETISTKNGCGKGQIFNTVTKRCQASKSTLVQDGEKPLIFNQTLISPQIVDLLPIFKYEEDKNKQ